ncbi:MAG TPA: thiamine pyrophosphate-dependent enzyme [Vicinamibacterales bacterium]|nr:thiamine pyrophosphate-dependent enzyme [Vicinamibacterales bacterium]
MHGPQPIAETFRREFGAFILERYPFAATSAREALAAATGAAPVLESGIDRLRDPFAREFRARLQRLAPIDLADPTPGVTASRRFAQAIDDIVDACDGFFRRAAIRASLTAEERLEMLRGMILTRATDNRLKAFFTNGEVRYGDSVFQGKGFRSLGQEAIYGAAIRLRRGDQFSSEKGEWKGDVVAPLIRDLGVTIAMRAEPETIRRVLSAQMGKAGPPMNGKDLHIGDMEHGIWPAVAPLGTGPVAMAGLAFAFAREQSGRVALSFIGEGGSSLGEWHEAVNLCAVRKLPAVFALENNQTALSTPVQEQSAVRVFADKAVGYGIPGITIDGTDPDAIAAAFDWAVQRAREGRGPTLIELISMRMCGHAHHDDMLYLGKDPPLGWEYPPLTGEGYVNRERYEFWAARDPIPAYAARLVAAGIIDPDTVEELKREAAAMVESQAKLVIEADWPRAEEAGVGVLDGEPPRVRVDVLDPDLRRRAPRNIPPLEPVGPFERKGQTFLEGVMLGVGDALRADSRVFVFGEDVGGQYGNAFLLLRPLLDEFGERIINSPICESAIMGVAIGTAIAGQRPIVEMQFNDFVATGFNQLVNTAAKIRYRWGGAVPMVVRMPWGGLRHAGPYHSQNTEGWFYRTPGLKIVAPATPADARALMASAVADGDPVLYYEHIALYRDPRIKQALGDGAPTPIPIGRAALRREGNDLAIISYGAYVHVALRVADRLASNGHQAAVLDLRSLMPLDREAILAVTEHCSRVLIVHEDTRTGSIGESVAAIIQEEAFEFLDAPIRIIGALDTPVPYSPPLEAAFLPSEDEIERAARRLLAY